MNKKLIQVEDKENTNPLLKQEKFMAFVNCSTTIDANGNEVFDKKRFADLIVGECVAAVLYAEVSMSSYMASIIETRLGYKPNYFNNQWFKDNWEIEKVNEV